MRQWNIVKHMYNVLLELPAWNLPEMFWDASWFSVRAPLVFRPSSSPFYSLSPRTGMRWWDSWKLSAARMLLYYIYNYIYIYMLLSDATIQFNGYLQMNILLVWICFNITLLYIAAYGSNSASFAVLLWGFCWGCCRTWWHTSLRLSSNTVNSWQQCWQYW